ncbi:MAG: LapA family protein, partial [Pseudomonadota bacterium]
FFTLFAFALNNQQVVSVNFFFGTQWQAPLVLVVLVTFAVGLAAGILMMMPRWWSKRRSTRVSPQNQHSENPSTMHHGL